MSKDIKRIEEEKKGTEEKLPAGPIKDFLDITLKTQYALSKEGNRDVKLANELRAQAVDLHLATLREFLQKEMFDRVDSAIESQNLAVKVVLTPLESKQGENDLKYSYDLFLNPKEFRPVKPLKPQQGKDPSTINRKQVFSTDDNGIIREREIAETRGGPKNTPWSKGTSVTLTLALYATKTFLISQDGFEVILLFDIRFCLLKHHKIFLRNMATNSKWYIVGTERHHEAVEFPKDHLSCSLEQIRAEQMHYIVKRQLIAEQNELVPCISLAAFLGNLAFRKEDKAYAKTQPIDRLNALYANYFFRQSAYSYDMYKEFLPLIQNSPIYILNPNDFHSKYTIANQINDLEIALSSPSSNEYKRVMRLRKEITHLEVYSPAIRLFFQMQENTEKNEKDVLDLKNILSAYKDGFPIERFTSQQLLILAQFSVDNFSKVILFSQNKEILQILLKQNKSSTSINIAKMTESDQCSDEQRARILSIAIQNEDKELANAIFQQIKSTKIIIDCFNDIDYYSSFKNFFFIPVLIKQNWDTSQIKEFKLSERDILLTWEMLLENDYSSDIALINILKFFHSKTALKDYLVSHKIFEKFLKGNTNLLDVMLDHGLSLEKKNIEGNTLLDLIIENDQFKMLDWINKKYTGLEVLESQLKPENFSKYQKYLTPSPIKISLDDKRSSKNSIDQIMDFFHTFFQEVYQEPLSNYPIPTIEQKRDTDIFCFGALSAAISNFDKMEKKKDPSYTPKKILGNLYLPESKEVIEKKTVDIELYRNFIIKKGNTYSARFIPLKENNIQNENTIYYKETNGFLEYKVLKDGKFQPGIISPKDLGLDTSSCYNLRLMSKDTKPEPNKLYLKEIDGKIAYTVITPNGKTVTDIKTEIKAPIPFDLSNLAFVKDAIFEVTSIAGHTTLNFEYIANFLALQTKNNLRRSDFDSPEFNVIKWIVKNSPPHSSRSKINNLIKSIIANKGHLFSLEFDYADTREAAMRYALSPNYRKTILKELESFLKLVLARSQFGETNGLATYKLMLLFSKEKILEKIDDNKNFFTPPLDTQKSILGKDLQAVDLLIHSFTRKCLSINDTDFIDSNFLENIIFNASDYPPSFIEDLPQHLNRMKIFIEGERCRKLIRAKYSSENVKNLLASSTFELAKNLATQIENEAFKILKEAKSNFSIPLVYPEKFDAKEVMQGTDGIPTDYFLAHGIYNYFRIIKKSILELLKHYTNQYIDPAHFSKEKGNFQAKAKEWLDYYSQNLNGSGVTNPFSHEDLNKLIALSEKTDPGFCSIVKIILKIEFPIQVGAHEADTSSQDKRFDSSLSSLISTGVFSSTTTSSSKDVYSGPQKLDR